MNRLPMLLHLFGGLTPMNVWDMTIEDFHVLAAAVDARVKAMKAR